jgi:hypothetical protein
MNNAMVKPMSASVPPAASVPNSDSEDARRRHYPLPANCRSRYQRGFPSASPDKHSNRDGAAEIENAIGTSCRGISRARRSMHMTYVTRARVISTRRAISAWLAVAGLDEGLPVDGLPEQLDHAGCLGLPARLGLASAGGTALTTRSADTRQDAHVVVFKRPLGPRAISTSVRGRPGHGAAVAGDQGHCTMRNQTSRSARPRPDRILLHSGSLSVGLRDRDRSHCRDCGPRQRRVVAAVRGGGEHP